MNRPGDLLSGVARLKHATRDFQWAWNDVQTQWNDAAMRDFQRRHLDPILPTLRLVMAATSELNDLYERALQECADPQQYDA